MSTNEPDEKHGADWETALRASVSPRRPDFEVRLENALVAEAARQRRYMRVFRLLRTAVPLAAAAALLFAVVLYRGGAFAPAAGQVKKVYGIVTVADGGSPREVQDTLRLADGQKIAVAWGSKAEITLADNSVLSAGPRTSVSVTRTPGGFTLTLEEGALSIAAARQPAGKSLRIETPGAQIKVLGTVLDVLVTDSDAPKTTRVSVKSGRVELVSAGTSVFLSPNMEGVAVPGEPPVTRAMTPEVNELVRLMALSDRLAAEGVPARSMPSIIDFSDGLRATVWLAVDVPNRTDASVKSLSFKAARPFSGAKAFLVNGVPLEARAMGALLQIDMSDAPIEARQKATIVLALSGVEGLLTAKPNTAFSFEGAASGGLKRMLVEFRLPEAAWVGQVSPEPIEQHAEAGMLVFVVDANTQPIGLIEEAGH